MRSPPSPQDGLTFNSKQISPNRVIDPKANYAIINGQQVIRMMRSNRRFCVAIKTAFKQSFFVLSCG